MFSSSKIKILRRRLKIKWSNMWVLKEIRNDGTIEIEIPYSKRIKFVIMKMLQQMAHPP